ncbi:ribbon-helix-helix protein, CopG family [Nocardioides carbamazepini]|jgi:hypothetical protein|uniref:ribbon-helix-helix protein, CopG family n=1 Tax=Nocardioides carbamazepini TaxID=2854259 RepID=UPI00214A7115|nr:ribbon-helix-helix protein, CopG family [Nocardioides carbamazepini]MCR1785204.1 ribbon-helix-helix protein, CopG family [Nocardioides carbamazepini]
MSHRTQITLEDEQYARLRKEAARTGLGLAELVRRAIDEVYGSNTVADRLHRLEISFGAWARVDLALGEAADDIGPLDGLDGADYVERLRPGLAARLAR